MAVAAVAAPGGRSPKAGVPLPGLLCGISPPCPSQGPSVALGDTELRSISSCQLSPQLLLRSSDLRGSKPLSDSPPALYCS